MEKRVEPEFFDEDYYLTKCAGYKEYLQSHGKEISRRFEIAIEMGNLKPNLKNLDVGCGRGEIVLHSAFKGAYATGIDYSRRAIDIGNDTLKQYDNEITDKTSLIIGDAKQLPFKNETFDRIFFLDIIEHLYSEEVETVFNEFVRILKLNGLIIIHTAPNLWVHKYTYPVFRSTNALLFRKKMPKKLDMYGGHKRTHVNKQSIFSLKKILDEYGFISRVWLEDPKPDKAVLNPDNEEKNILKRKIVSVLRSYYPFKPLFCNHIFAVGKKR